MDQMGRQQGRARTGWRFVMWLGLLGLLVGCGGNGGGAEADEREARPAEQPEQAAATSTTTPSTTTTLLPRVVYEIEGTGAVPVSYWIAGDRMQSREVTLPWSEEQVEEPSRLSMLVALTGSEGDVTCRIRRGAELLAETTLSATAGPLLSCDYPPTGLPPVTYPPGL